MHIERTIHELEELQTKISALLGFLTTDAFKELPLIEQAYLGTQMFHMEMYGAILSKRILFYK
jgi:hypothetical protein